MQGQYETNERAEEQGEALLYTLNVESSKARYIGPQVIFGIGIGLGNQVPMTALQSFSKPEHIAPTTGVMLSKFPRVPSSSICVKFKSLTL